MSGYSASSFSIRMYGLLQSQAESELSGRFSLADVMPGIAWNAGQPRKQAAAQEDSRLQAACCALARPEFSKAITRRQPFVLADRSGSLRQS